MKYFLILFTILFSSVVYADPSFQRIVTPGCEIYSSDLHYKITKYPLYNLCDNKKNTTWVFTTDSFTKTKNKWINISSNELINSIKLINGYSKSEASYYANCIITKISIVTGLDSKEYTLQKTLDFQTIALEKPTNSLKIHIIDIIKGKKYDDICISELKIYDNRNHSIIDEENYLIYSTAGEYPSYIVLDTKGNILYDPKSDGIAISGFSPKGSYAYFGYSEVDGDGMDIFNLKTKKVKNYLQGKYPGPVTWISENKLKVKWYDPYGNSGSKVLMIDN